MIDAKLAITVDAGQGDHRPGLRDGAVVSLVKPFSPTELMARMASALRRREVAEPLEPYVLGDLTTNYPARRASVAGRQVQLTTMEYRLLAELSVNAGKVLTYEHLLEKVWNEKSDADIRPMRTVVANLRGKLGEDARNPRYVLTETRAGSGTSRRSLKRMPFPYQVDGLAGEGRDGLVTRGAGE